MMYSCRERRMITVKWSLCLIFCLLNSILVIAKHLCLPDQRDSLWGFKNEFHVPSEKWRNNTDCCSWDGVSCDPKTGNVVGLDLAGSDFNGPLRSNSSLFRLQHLQKLYLGCNTSFGSLSYNDGLKGGELPDSIGNLKYLKVLSLRCCNLFGKIPSSLGNLSYLTHLDLSYNDFTSEGPDSMGNLNRLTDMLLKLSSVTWIDLGDNQLKGMLPSNMSSLSELELFDISENSFSGTIPSSLFMIPSLVRLNLGRNHFSGPLEIGNISSQSKLQLLHLGRNNFNGPIPSSLGSLSYLTHLDLSDNEFTSEPPDSMGNLNRLTDLQHVLLNLSSLIWIDLSSNKFRGMLPSNMSSLSELELFNIGENSFSGTIPSSLFMIPSLIVLHLRRNDFSGPFEIGNISSPSNLQLLYIGENNFNPDIVDLSIFSPLLSLGYLDVSGINLKISSTVSLPSPIEYLGLLSCNISEFPKFLRNQTRLSYLDISANQIEGQVPEWLWSLPELRYVNISQNSFNGFEGPADVIQRRGELTMLDISSNTFQDPFPLLPNSTEFLFSSNNRFSGEIPRAICELHNLAVLVLSNNNFSGSIPRCFENLHLYVLHLRNNSLSGIFLEESISHRLQSLDVGLNRLSGELPKSLINCTQLEFLNVEDNRLNDTFPSWLRWLPNLQMLVLRSNEFHGPISSPQDSLSFPTLRIFDISENHFNGVLSSDYFDGWTTMSSVVDIVDTVEIYIPWGSYPKSLDLINKGIKMELVGSSFTIYKTIDVSGNRLEGDIPESIGLLKELIVLNMSNNAFTGHIPPSLSNLSNLQSLDLSQNRLSGSIPPELGKLTFLARMNFSHNRLEGPIPQTTQIQTQDSSSFTENPGLCGLPLKKTCGGKEEATKQEQDEEKEEEEQVLSWIAAAIGYVPGVVCGLTIGHILVSHKRDWFMRIVSLFT